MSNSCFPLGYAVQHRSNRLYSYVDALSRLLVEREHISQYDVDYLSVAVAASSAREVIEYHTS